MSADCAPSVRRDLRHIAYQARAAQFRHRVRDPHKHERASTLTHTCTLMHTHTRAHTYMRVRARTRVPSICIPTSTRAHARSARTHTHGDACLESTLNRSDQPKTAHGRMVTQSYTHARTIARAYLYTHVRVRVAHPRPREPTRNTPTSTQKCAHRRAPVRAWAYAQF